MKAVDLTDGVGLIAQIRGASAHGPEAFISSIGVPDRSRIQYLSGSFGFLFGKQYLLTASRAFMGPRTLRDAPWQIGLTGVRLSASPG